MIAVETSTTIHRPAGVVFDYLADFENNPAWQRGMVEARWTSEPPIRVGSTYDQIARFLGKEIRTSFEVTHLGPGTSISIASVVSTFPIQVTRRVEALADDRCRVSALVSGDASGVFRLAEPMARFLVGRSVRADYARLKQILEATA